MLKQATSWISSQYSHHLIISNDPRHLPKWHAKTGRNAQFRPSEKEQVRKKPRLSGPWRLYPQTSMKRFWITSTTRRGMPIGQSGPPIPDFSFGPAPWQSSAVRAWEPKAMRHAPARDQVHSDATQPALPQIQIFNQRFFSTHFWGGILGPNHHYGVMIIHGLELLFTGH